MIISHDDYLTYELPNGWCAEENEENLIIYDPNGEGALTVSFFTAFMPTETLDRYLSIMAKKFIDQNKIKLHNPLIIYGTDETKITLFGSGVEPDNWFVKLWIVAKYPKIVFATYNCEKITREVKEYDAIINSMKFVQ